jgi:glutathione synthase/RimK-type ligase-like ATP-grasp enzyme
VKDHLLDAMLQQAQLTCDHSEVRSLFLRRQEATGHAQEFVQITWFSEKFAQEFIPNVFNDLLAFFLGGIHTVNACKRHVGTKVKSCEGQKLP